MSARLLLRSLAILIAVMGLVDPAITSERPLTPAISVLASDTRATTQASWRDVSTRLSAHYRIVDHLSPDAAATVLVGDALPASASLVPAPAFVVTPVSSQPDVAIARVGMSPSAALNARVPVTVTARVRHAQGRTLDFSIATASGVVLDRMERPVASDDARIEAVLHVAGVAAGAAGFDVTASVRDTSATDRASTVIQFGDAPWPVLVFDRRPSWSSTFLRRALERDARFAVTSRTMTSTGLASDRGQPPVNLSASDRLDDYAVIVVGAPDALTDADARALEAFSRRRGGAIVTIVDEPPSAPASRLMGVGRWDRVTAAEPVPIESAGVTAMQATEFIVPDHAPDAAVVLGRASTTGDRPVVFDRAIGGGRIIVSGAADAWRYRGVPETSVFDRFWQRTVAAAAAGAPPDIAISPAAQAIGPGGVASWRVVVREDALASDGGAVPAPRAIAAEMRDDAGTRTPVRLWPDGAPGRFVATIHAPRAGLWQLTVTSGGRHADAALAVSPAARTRNDDDEDLLRSWVASRGGRVVASTDLAALDRALAATLHPEHRATRWRPMHSSWWIVPFAALLGGEWWVRRRGNLS